MKKISKKLVVSATAAAFLSLAGAGVWAYAAPYSYVSLDVNPSIEYTLNRFDRVIDVEAVNDDGQAILENAGEFKNLTIEDAITKTVDELVEEGYLPATTSVTDVTETVSGSAVGTDGSAEAQQDSTSTETGTTVEATNETGTTTETTTGTAIDTTTTTGSAVDTTTTTGSAVDTTTTTGTDLPSGTTDTTTTDTTANADGSNDIVVGGIVITVSNKDIELTDELIDKIRDAVEDVISQEVEVEVMGVGYTRVQEARKLGVTPGKLNLVEKLKASSTDPDSIVISEWVNKPVKEIMQATKANKKAQIFKASIQSEETSEAVNEDTVADTVSGSAVALNTEDSNNSSEVNQNTGNIDNEDADDQGEDDNEDADDQGEDDNEDADDQGEDDDKEIRKEAYKAVKKAEKDAKLEAMKVAKEDSKVSRKESREAKKKADEAAREAKKLAKDSTKEANEQIRKAAEEEREAAKKVREASENDSEDAQDEDNNGGNDRKANYGSTRSAEKRNNQNNNSQR